MSPMPPKKIKTCLQQQQKRQQRGQRHVLGCTTSSSISSMGTFLVSGMKKIAKRIAISPMPPKKKKTCGVNEQQQQSNNFQC